MKKLNYLVSGILISFCGVCAFGQEREVAVTFDDLPIALGEPEFITKLFKRFQKEQ